MQYVKENSHVFGEKVGVLSQVRRFAAAEA
jgi:hypothetical protein